MHSTAGRNAKADTVDLYSTKRSWGKAVLHAEAKRVDMLISDYSAATTLCLQRQPKFLQGAAIVAMVVQEKRAVLIMRLLSSEWQTAKTPSTFSGCGSYIASIPNLLPVRHDAQEPLNPRWRPSVICVATKESPYGWAVLTRDVSRKGRRVQDESGASY